MNNFMTFLLRNSHQYPDLTFGGRIPARDDDHTNKMPRDLCSLCCAWFEILFLAVAGLECHGQRTQWHTDCTIEQILSTPNFAKMFLDCLKSPVPVRDTKYLYKHMFKTTCLPSISWKY